jgi:integrase
MGSILPRKRADGTTAYLVNIRIKKDGAIVHREAETFDREQAAKAWMKKREAELAKPGALDPKPEVIDPTLAEVIRKYNDEKRKEHGKTKTQVLRTIEGSEFAQKRCSQIDSPAIVEYIKQLDSLPQTRGNYVSHLASIFTVARPMWGYPLDTQAMEDARVVMGKMGIVSRSKSRDRRPTLAELDKLMRHYGVMELKRKDAIQMTRIIPFAIFSTRRQEEITRIVMEDLDADHLEIIVRDMKNPGEKLGNDVRTTLTPEALQIIQRQDKDKGEIFPFNSDSISTSFTKACAFLGIEDLTFHDLRHDGISRLFEMGWTIPQVSTVSGHRTWTSLQRYSHIRQAGDKYAGWPWLAKILAR